MTYGFSRDDVGRILDTYFEKKILESDPFARLDQNGVGKLVKMAVESGRKTRPDIKLGICGEHGGDLSSVEFCHNVGLNYVSVALPACRLPVWPAAQRVSRSRQGITKKSLSKGRPSGRKAALWRLCIPIKSYRVIRHGLEGYAVFAVLGLSNAF